MSSTTQRNNRERGFTLVELAVVIVIIGLIIGAVVKGQELIDNARVNSVISQVNSFRAAVTTFQERYGALPGDLATATTRIPGCPGVCTNGNGNGVIGAATQQAAAQSAEGAQAWQHLAFANLITGVVPGTTTVAQYNSNFPGARTGGGFTIVNGVVGTPATATHWVRLQGTAGNVAPGTGINDGALTPGQAGVIDRRLDDGNPLTGTVRFGGNAACVVGTAYNESSGNKSCNLYFQMQ